MSKKSRQGGSSIFLVIGVVFLLISLGLGVYLFVQIREYNQQAQLVDDVKNLVVSTLPSDDVNLDISTDVVSPTDNTVPIESEPDRTYIDANFLRKVDFEQLQNINADATRWLYIPDTPIDAYVMQEQTIGNYYYLWKDIYKNYSSSGSLLTPKLPFDGDDSHLLLFGHRIFGQDHVGFGSLRICFENQESASNYPYVYVYYPDRAERWMVWATCDVYASDIIYDMPYTVGTKAYADMLAHVSETARYEVCDRPNEWTNTLFLSTCNGSRGGSEVRLIVACVPDAAYYYDTKTIVNFGSHEFASGMSGVNQ